MIQPILIRNVTRCLSQKLSLIVCRYSHSGKTHYDTLNLKPNCTNDEIRQAFAKLSKEHHPDTSKANYTSVENSNKFQQIMEAYRVLNKSESRNAYNAKLSRSKPGPSYPPYNYGYERTRRYRGGQNFSNVSHGQQNPFSSHGPFDSSNKEQYDTWSTNPFLSFNRKGVFGIVCGLIVLQFLFLSARSRNPMKDFKDK